MKEKETMMDIKQKLENVAPDTSLRLVNFKMPKMQHRIALLVARHWDISMAELIRRSLNLTFSQINDNRLLKRIRDCRESYIREDI